MGASPLLEVKSVSRTLENTVLWQKLSFSVDKGDIVFVRGPSGSGKTLLLRAIAWLDPVQEGSVLFQGRPPSDWGIPHWRTHIAYVHQSRINYKGTPADFFAAARGFCAQRRRPHGDLAQLVEQLGMPPSVCHQPWSELSGGQAQRVALAVSLALKPDVLLLDEPTSACDAEAARRVEAVLKQCGAALLWVTHDEAQPRRVGGKQLQVSTGTLTSISSSSRLDAGGEGGPDWQGVVQAVEERPVKGAQVVAGMV